MRHLAEHNILADNQHAFRKARSCETQLIITMHDLTKNLESNGTTDLAVLDFSKAFDVIPHLRLLMKLDYYGIRGKTKNWISSFLTKRFQRVVVNGTSSRWLPVLSGTPQGTVLGPHLFLLHINDIHEGLSSTTRLFADDCLLYKDIKTREDEISLQEDLAKMVKWSDTWGMKFNPKKCKTMRVTRRRNPGLTSYNILGTTLDETQDTKYLGINIQNDLRWNTQTKHATGKATRVLNFIRRNFHLSSPSTKEKLYSTLVRPHLDYAAAAWDPYTQKNITTIENVQKRAARFVTNTYGEDTSITAILDQLNWDTLQDRREFHRLTCLYKILNDQMDIDHTQFISSKSKRPRRGHNNQFIINHTKTDSYKNSFFPRTVKTWNKLDPRTIIKSSPASFKSALSHDSALSSNSITG
jgi:hypothetical protein